MPIIKGAKKALRSSKRKRVYNVRRQSVMQDVVKKVRKAVQSGALDEAMKLMPAAHQAIDKAAKRGIIKDNTASRKKSRLAATVVRAKKVK